MSHDEPDAAMRLRHTGSDSNPRQKIPRLPVTTAPAREEVSVTCDGIRGIVFSFPKPPGHRQKEHDRWRLTRESTTW